MRIKERLSCAVGNVFNDLFRQLGQSYQLFFLMKIVELSPSEAALIILIGQIADASFSPIAGYLGDSANVPFLLRKLAGENLGTVWQQYSWPLDFPFSSTAACYAVLAIKTGFGYSISVSFQH